jgi:hypothetical protein
VTASTRLPRILENLSSKREDIPRTLISKIAIGIPIDEAHYILRLSIGDISDYWDFWEENAGE